MFIQRDYNFTEHDDFVRNVSGKLSDRTWATPIYHPKDGYILGWMVKTAYE